MNTHRSGRGFLSGDMACRDEEGFFYIRDRLKDVIIRGGENIAGGAVENAIYKDERVLHCAAVGVPDPKLGELVVRDKIAWLFLNAARLLTNTLA